VPSSSSSTSATPSATAAATAPATSASVTLKPTTLKVVGYEGNDQEPADIAQINSAFEAKYPGVKIDYKYVANANYPVYLNTRFAAGSAEDVVMTDETDLQNWATQGYLQDLGDQPWVSRLAAPVIPATQVNGKTYSFVQQNIPIGMFANLDLLSKAGITAVPRTFADLVADLKTLKAKGLGGLQVPNKVGWGSEHLIQFIGINQMDTNKFDAGYIAGTDSYAKSWTQSLDMAKSLVADGFIDGKAMNGTDEFSTAQDEFAAGKYAFTVDGAWNLSKYKKDAKFKFTMNAFPGGSDAAGLKAETYLGSGWAINAKTKNLDAAKAYVDWMTQKDQLTGYLTAESAFSTIKDVPSPSVAESAPIKAAYDAGNWAYMPDEGLEFKIPNAHLALQKTGQKFFNDPSLSSASLAKAIDTGVGRPK
jgi:raffinose/stachyose/melibiose transport system substrate-binding protein